MGKNKIVKGFTLVIVYSNPKSNGNKYPQKLANYCPVCQTLMGLRHEAKGKFEYVCICGYSRPIPTKNTHLKTHNRCPRCERNFAQRISYLQHCRATGHNMNQHFKDYKKQGLSIDQMIHLENSRNSHNKIERNHVLSYLMKMKYDFKCQVCTKHILGAKIVVHHIKPISKKGRDHSKNLIVLCDKHHKAAHDENLNLNIFI